jgi:hypothetical protein
VLVHCLQQELAHLGSGVAEDRAALGKRGLGEAEASALRFRIEKKTLLEGVLARLTS